MSGTDRPQNLFTTASDGTYAGAASQGVHPLNQGLPLLQHSYAQERSGMEYRELGGTGLRVSVVGYGTAPLGDMFGSSDEEAGLQSAYRALDAGINFFDSSPSYGMGLAEERLGKVLRGRRHEIIVGTKAGRYGPEDFDFSAVRIRRGFEESLRLLGTDYVDILQLHNVEFVHLEGPISEAYGELVRLRDAGMCRFIGMTGYPTAMTRRVISEFDLDVTLSYAHGTLLDDCVTDEVLPLAKERGVGVINAAAVALGLLTEAGPPPHIADLVGKEICAVARRVVEVCQRRGADVSFLANQYSIQRSGCATTLIGTTNQRHLDSAVAATAKPIDEELLADVLTSVGADRRRHWISGLPQNN
jgi:L-galactose dehydrogenase